MRKKEKEEEPLQNVTGKMICTENDSLHNLGSHGELSTQVLVLSAYHISKLAHKTQSRTNNYIPEHLLFTAHHLVPLSSGLQSHVK